QVLQRQLDKARVRSQFLEAARAGDDPSGAVDCHVAGMAQRGSVEQVEDVGAKLQGLFAEDWKDLEDGHVDALETGTEDIVSPAAQKPECRGGVGHINRLRRCSIVRVGAAGRNVMAWFILPVVGVPWVLERAGVVPVAAGAGPRGTGH